VVITPKINGGQLKLLEAAPFVLRQHMTGVGDIICAARRQVRRSPTARALLTIVDFWLELLPASITHAVRAVIFPAWWVEDLLGASAAWVLQRRPDCRETMRLMQAAPDPAPTDARSAAAPCQWGLLLPITSRGCTEDTFWVQLESTLRQLVASVPPCRRPDTRIHIGIDMQDPVLDSVGARARIEALLAELGGVHFAKPLVPAFQGKICWIWAELAKQAVAAGAEFFVLLGDDVILHDVEWQADVEAQFEAIAAERRLPFGCGCVAVRDKSFSCFPTFPVLHQFHLEAFGKLFPCEFINQHGDPFLFELYRRWGAPPALSA
jgi:hypothetical protein